MKHFSAPSARRRALSAGQVQNAIDALGHALHIGCPPTHLITIDWELADVLDTGKATGRLVKYLKDALRRRGYKTSYIWVQEQGPVLGHHVHLLIHIPDFGPNWLGRRLPGWLKKCGATRRRGVCRSRAIAGKSFMFSELNAQSDWYLENVAQTLAYVLKHSDESQRDVIGRRPLGPTEVVGKQVSVSQNIGSSARSRCPRCTSRTSEFRRQFEARMALNLRISAAA